MFHNRSVEDNGESGWMWSWINMILILTLNVALDVIPDMSDTWPCMWNCVCLWMRLWMCVLCDPLCDIMCDFGCDPGYRSCMSLWMLPWIYPLCDPYVTLWLGVTMGILILCVNLELTLAVPDTWPCMCHCVWPWIKKLCVNPDLTVTIDPVGYSGCDLVCYSGSDPGYRSYKLFALDVTLDIIIISGMLLWI